MNTKNQIIISAASVSAALGAIGNTAINGDLLHVPAATTFDQAAQEAVNTPQSQAAVRVSIPYIARAIRLDSSLRQAPYSEIAEEDEQNTMRSLLTPDTIDSMEWDGNGDMEVSPEQMIQELGLTVPDGMTAEEFLDQIEGTLDSISDILSDPDGQDLNQILNGGKTKASLVDSTMRGSYFSCYNNCHSACHGSRGWR